MRFDTLTTLAGIVVEMFDKYVAPAAKSMMSGEVPSAMLTVHRTGTIGLFRVVQQDSAFIPKFIIISHAQLRVLSEGLMSRLQCEPQFLIPLDEVEVTALEQIPTFLALIQTGQQRVIAGLVSITEHTGIGLAVRLGFDPRSLRHKTSDMLDNPEQANRREQAILQEIRDDIHQEYSGSDAMDMDDMFAQMINA